MEIINEIYNNSDILEGLNRPIFITLHKKLHQTISLMSHIIKLIIKIQMNKACNKIIPQTEQEQCGFVKDTRTRNAIFILRMYQSE